MTKPYYVMLAALGVYVDCNGKRSRSQELMWPSQPIAASESSKSISPDQISLLIYTEKTKLQIKAIVKEFIQCYSQYKPLSEGSQCPCKWIKIYLSPFGKRNVVRMKVTNRNIISVPVV